MAKIQVFLDTDVVIASFLSKAGASYEIIKNSKVDKIKNELGVLVIKPGNFLQYLRSRDKF